MYLIEAVCITGGLSETLWKLLLSLESTTQLSQSLYLEESTPWISRSLCCRSGLASWEFCCRNKKNRTWSYFMWHSSRCYQKQHFFFKIWSTFKCVSRVFWIPYMCPCHFLGKKISIINYSFYGMLLVSSSVRSVFTYGPI